MGDTTLPTNASPTVERLPSRRTLALPTNACPPGGNASLPVKRQRYSASKPPEDKRTPQTPLTFKLDWGFHRLFAQHPHGLCRQNDKVS